MFRQTVFVLMYRDYRCIGVCDDDVQCDNNII